MEQATATEIDSPKTIEYGGVIWIKNDDISRAIEYTASQPECGRFRIYQYPHDSIACAGRWLWSVNFNTMVSTEYQPALLKMEASEVVDEDIETAMQACLDAKNIFIADIKQLATQLGIGGGPCYCPGSAYAEAANAPVIGCKRIDGGADCLVPASGCSACSNAIFEQVAAPAASACGTCHHACDCREHKVAELIKAALDAAVQLDDMKNCIVVSSLGREGDRENRRKNAGIVERVYAACEALGVDIGKHEVAA